MVLWDAMMDSVQSCIQRLHNAEDEEVKPKPEFSLRVHPCHILLKGPIVLSIAEILC